MHHQNKIGMQKPYIIMLASIVLGSLIGFLILQEHIGEGEVFHKIPQGNLQLAAYFKDDKLMVSITNLGVYEIEVQMIFIEGQNYIDFDTPLNLVVKPNETIEIKTDIMKPNPGTYTVKVRLSNGQTINHKIRVTTDN